MQHDLPDPLAGRAESGRQEAVREHAQARRDQRHYWRGVVRWTWLGLATWLFVTCVVSWFAGSFNQWTVAGAPAGFWLAAQGAIVAYLVIIVVHGWVMDRLEVRLEQQHRDRARPASTSAPS
ncbi:DUF4212 domain-containing protein [Leptothrix discophora]|uniref:DUF4212 domain-containing protein n=1 Tax=Leptothrix discophora TaxID=89 RepID=A0ABT9G150_LEPDI|nr:DUF4212 domain-containing protein [Leptothrix discophora]MDP4300173.1 DUF4212 domain-containing protein [Leptothrix discophora]